MVLTRATIRDKLNLLLLVPLLATVLLALPFVAARVDEARAASVTATAATNARQISDLLYAVQRERLAAVDHLTAAGHQHSLMLRYEAQVDDAMADLRRTLDTDPSPRLRAALGKLDGLENTRESVRSGAAKPDEVFEDYRRITDALFEALGLQVRTGDAGDADRQLETLDTLLRANEQSSRVGAAMLVATLDQAVGRGLLVEASALRELHQERFMRVAGRDLATMMRAVDKGASAAVLDDLSTQVRESHHHLGADFVAEARDIAETQAVLRQLLLVRTVRQVETAATEGAERAIAAAWTVGVSTVLVIALVVVLGVSVSRSIAGPVRHLTHAASRVARMAGTELARVSDDEHNDDRPPRLAAIAVRSRDEVGDLAHAFNQVQATAALLLERQAHTRRNVGLMFSSVARRTQNLVGGQLALIDQMERNEQDPKLLAELYRLDHLSMRLRRSAESLLVVSGVRDETRLEVPAPLATVLRSALAEIEDFQRVRLIAVTDVTVAPSLVADLSLLVAELLENATSFSPPHVVVEVTAELNPSGCRIAIVDHGMGMSAEQMAEENDRFLQRERLDIAPTTVLGLFVVGRLARRHGLAVELRPTPGGGVTAVVGIPARLFTTDPQLAAGPITMESVPVPPAATGGVAVPPAFVVPDSRPAEGFEWFVNEEEPMDGVPSTGPGTPAATPAGSSGPADAPSAGSGGPLADRDADDVPDHPGESVPRAVPDSGTPRPPSAPSTPDMLPSREGLHSPRPAYGATSAGVFGSGTPGLRVPDPGTPDPPPPGTGGPTPGFPVGTAGPGKEAGRGGLTRRVPGANLGAGAQPRSDEVPRPTQAPLTQRDPERERASLDAFASAVERAAAETESSRISGRGFLADEGSAE